MSRTGLIYALCDPESREIRYIGQTVDLRQRVRSHRHSAFVQMKRWHLSTWIRSLGCEPFVMVVEEGIPQKELNDRERHWIRESQRKGCRLTNATTGGTKRYSLPDEARHRIGEASRQRVVTTQSRNRMSEAQRRRFQAEGVSAETRRKRSENSKRLGLKPPSPRGRKATPEARANMSAAQKGLKRKGEVRQCKSCKSEFYAPRAELKRGNGHFCGKSCATRYRKVLA